MPNITATDISLTALNPTIWANMMQVPLRKSLVSEAIADTKFEASLSYGDAITQPYMEDATIADYTPGTIFSAQGASAKEDTLDVDKFKVSPTYVDDINSLQAKYAYAMDIIDDQAYQLQNQIDSDTFETAGRGAGLYLVADATANSVEGVIVTAAFANVSAASALKVHDGDTTVSALSPIELFSRARKELRAKNVTEAGDWVSVIDPSIAQQIEMIAADKGFSVADTTLRNGYAGNFLGFKVYVSNNLFQPTAGNNTGGSLAYFGKSKRVGLVVQMPPKVHFKDVPNKLGTNVVTSIVYGTKVFTKNAERYLCALLTT